MFENNSSWFAGYMCKRDVCHGKPEDDITFEKLHHGCIHSHKTYPEKAEKRKAGLPSRGQRLDKAVAKQLDDSMHLLHGRRGGTQGSPAPPQNSKKVSRTLSGFHFRGFRPKAKKPNTFSIIFWDINFSTLTTAVWLLLFDFELSSAGTKKQTLEKAKHMHTHTPKPKNRHMLYNATLS